LTARFPIPEARFTLSEILRLLAIALTLSQPKLPDDLEELAFAIVSRMVLMILINGVDHPDRRSQGRVPARRTAARSPCLHFCPMRRTVVSRGQVPNKPNHRTNLNISGRR
jgi:hypothetical protein